MFSKICKLIENYKSIFIIAFALILTICFETFQQIFYLKRFNLSDNVEFFKILKSQSYRWGIWLLIGFLLPFFIKKDSCKEASLQLFFKYVSIILLLVIVNVCVISIIQMIISNAVFSFENFFSEYFLFFLFQKTPMYALGYCAISIILFFGFENKKLTFEILQLIQIKKTNEIEYQKIKEKNTDRAEILNIKIGNKRKLIPVEEIVWLEADDYCVNVHTEDKPSYSMRSSLKSLEDKLKNNFLRVHRKAIVNMNMVKELDLSTNPSLILKNDIKIPVSKSNLKEVKAFLNS